MGSEAVSNVTYRGLSSEGKALLETSELIFRGDFRLRIPFSAIEMIEAEGGELRIRYEGSVAVFSLGPQAESWAEKIRNPRGLLDKLGVKPGMSVAVIGLEDQDFAAQLRTRVAFAAGIEAATAADVVFYRVETPADLAALATLRSLIKPSGAIWVVSPKGKAASIKDTDVMAAARAAGLVDTKVASFSPLDTALKLVIPKALRPG